MKMINLTVIVGFIFTFVVVTAKKQEPPLDPTCEPLTSTICKGHVGYNQTVFPNRFGHASQSQAELELSKMLPLIEYGCARSLRGFLCFSYMPMCVHEHYSGLLEPCREFCQLMKADCEPVLKEFGMEWPNHLKCRKFPKTNNPRKVCIGHVGNDLVTTIPNTPKTPEQESTTMAMQEVMKTYSNYTIPQRHPETVHQSCSCQCECTVRP